MLRDDSKVLEMVPACLLSLPSFEPLKLRRPDSRRSTTQTWYFSSGMLTCGLPRLVVQVGSPVSSEFRRFI